MSDALHSLRNALTPLALSDDDTVRACSARILELLPALAVDAAVVAGLRARLADTEARLAATEQALDARTAATVRAALACPTCDDTGSITVAPPGLGGPNSPHAVDVRCPDCNDTGGF